MDPFDTGDWDNLCLGEVSGASETCGAGFDADPDADAPTVSVTMPADETTFDTAPADVTVTIETDDGEGWGVRFVRVKVDGDEQPLVLREPPFQFNADFPQGVFEIVGVSEDWAGNIGESEPIRIAIDAELPPEPEETSSGSLDDAGTDEGTGDGSTSTPIDGTSTGDGPATDTEDPGETESGGCGCSTEQHMGPPALSGLLGGLVVLASIRRRLRSAGPRP
jgi:MYXO-CTERM domain-containing protein